MSYNASEIRVSALVILVLSELGEKVDYDTILDSARGNVTGNYLCSLGGTNGLKDRINLYLTVLFLQRKAHEIANFLKGFEK